MPTFHHWRAGKQRNGLTFQTAADARAFDKGVLRAYNELIDGMQFSASLWPEPAHSHLAACRLNNTLKDVFYPCLYFSLAYTNLV